MEKKEKYITPEQGAEYIIQEQESRICKTRVLSEQNIYPWSRE